MPRFQNGETVKIKKDQPMAGYLGIIINYNKETHTYLVRFNHEQQLFFPETALERKQA
ncbi:MAG: hypothetical protein L0M04_03060 [Enterococcus sp.]|uniref:hypothetical protein n=1 Tax=Enterococcus TaxID=1350 RepID=UPI002648F1E7|nr:hypothetical protein [Enterococcus sp.]MDN6003802.1 hypothetical protein [Enterococcus sp.]MDN6216427.1 hypothetical protein [Enterococcus sp.]MDN6559910.1 hypothetical protein [Enterococcus sp.]MDN6616378.1 hypothetical protein [Enterococcus sp.]MDN6752427.1 hypothetical protein [Enterococcus sp.]